MPPTIVYMVHAIELGILLPSLMWCSHDGIVRVAKRA